jgi:hypothetical protein
MSTPPRLSHAAYALLESSKVGASLRRAECPERVDFASSRALSERPQSSSFEDAG